jgi:hypothetical protein
MTNTRHEKKFNKDGWIAFTGIVCISGIFYLLWLVGSFFINNLVAIDPRISVPVIGTMITAIIGLSATIITQRQTKLREIEEAHREKKVEIYQKFIKTVTSLIAGQNEQVTIKAPTDQEVIDSIFTYKTEILLWGSPKVIKSQLEFAKTTNSGGDTLSVFTSVNNIYKAIREDIGLSNEGLNDLELIKIFLKDPSEIDDFRNSKKTSSQEES